MPKTQTSKTKVKKTDHDSHEERYGDLRNKLSGACLLEIVEAIAGKNYDSEAAAALVLLMDEIERSQFDRLHICDITQTVSHAAFKYTIENSDAEQKMIMAMRSRAIEAEVCNA